MLGRGGNLRLFKFRGRRLWGLLGINVRVELKRYLIVSDMMMKVGLCIWLEMAREKVRLMMKNMALNKTIMFLTTEILNNTN